MSTTLDIAQEIQTFFTALGLESEVVPGEGNFEDNYVIRLGMREQAAVASALDVHTDPSGHIEFFSLANVSTTAANGAQTKTEPVLMFPEERMDELRAIAGDQQQMDNIQTMVDMQVNAVPDSDIGYEPQYDPDIAEKYQGPQW